MIVLGIESSCDETSSALVKDGLEVMESLVLSQIDTHAVFQGVVPEIAAREHLKVIDQITSQVLKNTGSDFADIDLIAVTAGPGLVGSLLVGASYAKGLALGAQKPLIPVNHVHAHVFGALLGTNITLDNIEAQFPLIAAVVSGGHTNLYYLPSATCFELIASTIDDACGESFDKVARLLGLGYPGGPIIEKMATEGDPKTYKMPQMMEQKSRLAFSYSGLKTHIVNLVHRIPKPLSKEQIRDIAAAFQEESLGQLVRKISAAIALKPATKNIIIAGGVAANQRFRELVRADINLPTFFPELKYCGDNGAMIASMGYFSYLNDARDSSKYQEYDWDVFSNYGF